LTFIMCVYGALTGIDALLVLVFPETKDRDMPDTVNEAEYRMKNRGNNNDKGKEKEKKVENA